MARGLQEKEIRERLALGGKLRNVLFVTVPVGEHVEYLAYIRPSWRRRFLPLRTWGDKTDRTYRDMDRLLQLVRDGFGYQGVIPIYLKDDPEIPRYRALISSHPDDTSLLDRLEQAPPLPSG